MRGSTYKATLDLSVIACWEAWSFGGILLVTALSSLTGAAALFVRKMAVSLDREHEIESSRPGGSSTTH